MGRRRADGVDDGVALVGQRRETGVGEAERLAVCGTQDASGVLGLGGAQLRRPAAAGLAPRKVHERHASPVGRLTGQGASHDELGVVGMGAERSDVEGSMSPTSEGASRAISCVMRVAQDLRRRALARRPPRSG